MRRAVILLSGGLDSATVLALARSEGFSCFALSIDYGQRHAREIESATRLAAAFDCERHLILRADLTGIGGSALTTRLEVPKSDRVPNGRIDAEAIPVTYVPARNTVLLSLALGWAEVLGAGDLFIGANAVDYSGYPDCRPEFLRAFEAVANLATRAGVEGTTRFRVHAPLLHLTKAEIVTLAVRLGLDFALTWSCYDPGEMDRPCRQCDACRLRQKGFAEAGVDDSLTAPR